MNSCPADYFFKAANYLHSPLDLIILKMIAKEKAMSVREIAGRSYYSVREIQSELKILLNKKVVLRVNLPGVRYPVYYLNAGRIPLR